MEFDRDSSAAVEPSTRCAKHLDLSSFYVEFQEINCLPTEFVKKISDTERGDRGSILGGLFRTSEARSSTCGVHQPQPPSPAPKPAVPNSHILVGRTVPSKERGVSGFKLDGQNPGLRPTFGEDTDTDADIGARVQNPPWRVLELELEFAVDHDLAKDFRVAGLRSQNEGCAPFRNRQHYFTPRRRTVTGISHRHRNTVARQQAESALVRTDPFQPPDELGNHLLPSVHA